MKYVLDVVYDDMHQKCVSGNCPVEGGWRGGPYDEPFKVCPICFGHLEKVIWEPR